MAKKISLSLPIYYTKTSRKSSKTFLVSMNWFRNAYFYQQNEVKKHYHELVHLQLVKQAVRFECKYRISMKLYYKVANIDPSNVCPLIEKFVLDALQDKKVVIQDNVKYHKSTVWEVAGIDKHNPRIEIEIEEVI